MSHRAKTYRFRHLGGRSRRTIFRIWFLKRVRSGNRLSTYHSADSVTWTQVGVTETITMTGTVCVGLVSCSIINAAHGNVR